MAFRGRGRGRGGGPYHERHGKNVPFIPFPEDVKLPEITPPTKEDLQLIARKFRLESFWKNSCYYLEDPAVKSKKQEMDIQRYSDMIKQKSKTRREHFTSYMKLTPSNFPVELIQGKKRTLHDKKRLRWDRDSEDKVLDLFEKLESSEKIEGDNLNEKKEDTDDDDEDKTEEADEQSSDDGDYNQNIDFEDDEDDVNMEEEEYEDAYD